MTIVFFLLYTHFIPTKSVFILFGDTSRSPSYVKHTNIHTHTQHIYTQLGTFSIHGDLSKLVRVCVDTHTHTQIEVCVIRTGLIRHLGIRPKFF